ncbi:MAG: hypothetical protein V5A62_05875 [Haloarculaceae archaeon]
MAHGPEAVHELIEESGWSYPVSVRRLESEHALANVQLDERGNTAMLSEVLSRGDFDRFESRSDLEEKVGSAIDRELSDRGTGLLARIKRTFIRR